MSGERMLNYVDFLSLDHMERLFLMKTGGKFTKVSPRNSVENHTGQNFTRLVCGTSDTYPPNEIII